MTDDGIWRHHAYDSSHSFLVHSTTERILEEFRELFIRLHQVQRDTTKLQYQWWQTLRGLYGHPTSGKGLSIYKCNNKKKITFKIKINQLYRVHNHLELFLLLLRIVMERKFQKTILSAKYKLFSWLAKRLWQQVWVKKDPWSLGK